MRYPVASSCVCLSVIALFLPQEPAPAPMRDSAAFERPRPVCTATRDASQTFTAVVRAVQGRGFEISRAQANEGWVEAARADAQKPNDASDRVLVWLERDYSSPKDAVRLHVIYGRFLKLFGETEMQRVRSGADEEAAHIGDLKTALLNLCLQ